MDDRQELVLLRTKLYSPSLPGEPLIRQRLMAILDHALEVPLTLIVAPAGYGKTTLASSWLARCEAPHAWVSLDAQDDELDTFVAYLLAAIELVNAEACRNFRRLAHDPTSVSDTVLASVFMNDLDTLEAPFVVVLDDFQAIHDSSIVNFLSHILAHPPRSLHLVLISRVDPALPLQPIRARGQLVEIRAHELAFSLEETTEFLRQNAPQWSSETRADRLFHRTEGWAAGLRLAVLADRSMEQNTDFDPLGSSTVDYLIGDILAQQPQHLQDWLLRTSIVENLNADLCTALCLKQDGSHPTATGEDILAAIIRANLFVSLLDARREWIRYHDLFQQSLRIELAQRYSPAEIEDLHARAASAYADMGLVDKAIKHALAARLTGMAISLVADDRHTLIDREQWAALERRLRLFSRDEIDLHPQLSIIEAWVANMHGHWHLLQQCLAGIDAQLTQVELPRAVADPIRGEVHVLRANLLGWSYDGAQLSEHAERALQLLPRDWGYARAAAYMLQSYAHLLLGQPQIAEENLRRRLVDSSRSQLPHHRSLLFFGLTGAYWLMLQPEEMESCARQYLAHGEQHHLPESTSVANYYLGILAFQRNDLEVAARHFAAGADASNLSTIHFQIQAVCCLALTYLAQARSDEAEQILQEHHQLMMERGNDNVQGWLKACRAEIALATGHAAAAVHWTHTSEPLPLIGLQMLYLPHLTRVKALLAQGTEHDLREARALLKQMEETARHAHLKPAVLALLPYQAALYERDDDRATALAKLEEAVRMAAPAGFLRPFLDPHLQLAGLLRELAATGTAQPFIVQILEAISERPGVKPTVVSQPTVDPLTDRELEVLGLLAERLSNQEISHRLVITQGTVKQHTHNIYQKLAVTNRREAVLQAVALGIIPTQ